MERLVIKGFRDKKSHKDEKKMTVYPRNSKFKSSDEKRVKELEDKGYLKKVESPKTEAPKDESDPVEETTKESEEEPELKHLGGGYYELPNGEKVQGKEKALEALKDGE